MLITPYSKLSETAGTPSATSRLQSHALKQVQFLPRAARSAARQAVVEILEQAAHLSVEDQAILLAIAEHESGFNPAAQNPHSSAYGVFQIIDRTWKGLGFSLSQRSDLTAQIQAGVLLFGQNLASLTARIGQDIHGSSRCIEAYVLHHDGPSGTDFGGRRIAGQSVLPKFVRYIEAVSLD